MKTIPAALLDTLALGGMTLVRCWRITTRLGVALGFTKHTRDLDIEDFAFTALAGIRDTAIESAEGLQVDNQEITLFVSQLDKADIAAGVYDGARVEVFDVDFQDVSAGTIPHKVGILGNINAGEGIAKAELRGPAQFLQTKIGEVYTTTCPVRLGSDRCKVQLYNRLVAEIWVIVSAAKTLQVVDADLAEYGFNVGDTIEIIGSSLNDGFYTIALIVDDTMTLNETPPSDETVFCTVRRYTTFSFAGEVTAVDTGSPRRIFTIDISGTLPSGVEIAADDFQEGEVTFTSGDNQGVETKSIRTHTGYQLTLYDEFPYDIQIGDTVLIAKGCNKLHITCKDKFNNLINFQGFPFVPVPEEVFDSPVTIA